MRRLVGKRPLKGRGFETIRVEIDGGVIAAIETLSADTATQPILSPGWIDLQCNGALGRDFSISDEFDGVPGFLAATGVTGFLATVVTARSASYRPIIERLAVLGSETGARCLGIHLEGPFLSPQYRGAHNPEWLRGFDDPLVEELAAEQIRMITLAPEMDGGREVIGRLCGRGTVVSAGHSAATFQESLDAFEAGVGAGTHLFNAMPPLHHREPGLAGALLQPTSPPTGLIADGRHVHQAMLRLAWAARGAEGLFLVTDAIPSVGLPSGEYELSGQRVIMGAEDARLADGELAGSVLRMNEAVSRFAAWTGDLHGALRAASETPARVLGLAGRRGCLEPGYDADILLLDDRLNVLETLVAGETVYRAPYAGAR